MFKLNDFLADFNAYISQMWFVHFILSWWGWPPPIFWIKTNLVLILFFCPSNNIKGISYVKVIYSNLSAIDCSSHTFICVSSDYVANEDIRKGVSTSTLYIFIHFSTHWRLVSTLIDYMLWLYNLQMGNAVIQPNKQAFEWRADNKLDGSSPL